MHSLLSLFLLWTESFFIAVTRNVPRCAKDSEEFLTILGKKMGKLVKGGDADPWLC